MKFPSLCRALVAGLSFLVLMTSGGAHAAFRHYLSVSGSDANPCTLVAPCRLLPAALAVVDPGGEIWMLDSANYNTASPVVVSKSVTILAIPGRLGSVVGINGTAFEINAPGIDVTLQNLNILSFSNNGDIGVLISDAAQVSIVNCNIFGFKGVSGDPSGNGLGIWMNTGATVTKLNVVGSVIRDNSIGILVAGNGRATVSKTHVLGNAGAGIMSRSVTAFSVVNVSDSVSSGNSHGFVADSCLGTCTSQMFVTRSVAADNVADGFLSQGGAGVFMAVEDSMATRNGNTGFNNVAGTFQSRGNNTVSGNFNAQTSGTITPLSGL